MIGQGDLLAAAVDEAERGCYDGEPDLYWCKCCDGEPLQAIAIVLHRTRGAIAVCRLHLEDLPEAELVGDTVLL
jgi:hypothetical protein